MARMLEIPAELAGVQMVVAAALSRVEGTIRGALASEIAPVQRLVQHVEAYHGKMIRPTLVSLCGLAVAGRADEGALTQAHITLGAVVEMVHLATLVHDDVLDEADQRRMTETVNRLRGNEAAVMLGDYLFSAAYRLCGQLGDAHATVRIGQTGMTLCAGELLQLDNRGNYSLDEATYYALIDRKTASLISVSCELGARASGADEALATRLARFGTSLGLAFQIQDDLLDLAGDQRLVGKSLGKDAEKGKLTLPVIHHLAMADATARGRTLRLLRDGPAGATSWAEARTELAKAVESTGSITHSRREAQRLVDEAKGHLASLKPGPARALMEAMADAVVTRAF